MNDFGDFEIGLLVAAVAIVAFCIFGMYMAVTTANDFQQKCEARNGYVYSVKGRHICLKRESVVELER